MSSNFGWLEKEVATHSSILAWKIPWTEETGWPTVQGVAKESDMTECMCVHTHTHTHAHIDTVCPARRRVGAGRCHVYTDVVLTLLRTQRAEVTTDIQEPLLCFRHCLFQSPPPSHKVVGLTPTL